MEECESLPPADPDAENQSEPYLNEGEDWTRSLLE
jgi:hypothetical protein